MVAFTTKKSICKKSIKKRFWQIRKVRIYTLHLGKTCNYRILGPHWFPNDDTSLPTLASVKFNELKSRFNKELVDVYGVPVSQVDIEDGEDFNVVKELLTPPKESPDKEITEFLNTLWSIGALQQLMPELLEYKKLHRKKVWNIEINTFSGLVGFEYFLNFLHQSQ